MAEDHIECESSTVISIESLIVYENKYYMQGCLDGCACKIANKQMTDFLMKIILKIRYYKCCITTELI